MKPNFALDLSHDGIGLVHRGKGGWALVGEVSLEHPQLASGLDLLRRKAADLESGGFSSKLIIPGSQILFTTVTAPGPDDITREARIREGLEGLTPYDTDDLVFDWQADPTEDGMVHVAVVARETLDEAEAFAVEHKLNPVSLVARPSGNFSGEAFFGPVNSGPLTNGAVIERDSAPVPELMGTVPSDHPNTPAPAEITQTDAPSAEKPKLPELAPFPLTLDDPVPPRAEASRRKSPSKSEESAKATPAAIPEPPLTDVEVTSPSIATEAPPPTTAENIQVEAPTTEVSGIVPPPPPPLPADDITPSTLTPTFSSQRSESVEAASATNGVDANPVDVGVKPRLSFGVDRTGNDVAPASVDAQETPPPSKPVHVPVTAPIAFGDDPALKPPKAKSPRAPKKVSDGEAPDSTGSDKLKSAARKGAAGLAAAADTAGTIGRKAAKKIDDRRKEKAEKAADERPERKLPNFGKNYGNAGADDANTAIAPPPPHLTGGEQPTKSPRAREAESMTVFGARQTQVGGKPKYLGLFLVMGLLLVMAIVAVWSMFFLTDSTAWLFPERQDQFEAAISTDVESDLDEAANADLDSGLVTVPEVVETNRTPGTSDPLSPEAAQARYAATGIWQRAPEPLPDPETSQLDDLYIASIDPLSGAQDAIALPDPTLTASAAQELNTAAPPPLGTTFTIGSDGFVQATVAGALTPDGVVVFAGRPALVPAPRPGGETVVAEPSDVASPAQPQIRPRARPEGLIEGNERLQLGGRTRVELAVLRPRYRPTTPRANAQAAAITAALQADNTEAGNPSTAALVSPTTLAIDTSIGPRHRPNGFGKIVARALDRGDASDGSVVVAAASPRQTVVPKIPTRASVSKQATIKNAINLRKVSLIGIYGSASARRALVRMPNGRYVKVGAGSRLDGGKVLSISTTKLTYKKGSRTITLKVLPFS